LPYDHIRDFAPLSLIGKTPNVLVVHPSCRRAPLKEFVDYVKASPGKYNYGSPGFGTSPQMTMELFKLTAGVDIVHVPYKGGAPALADVMGGQITGMFGNLPEQLLRSAAERRAPCGQHAAAHALAARRADRRRIGLPGFRGDGVVRRGYAVRGAEADPRQAQRHAAEDAEQPEMKARLAENTIEAEPGTPEQFAAFIAL
jgi:tripartite-type tricarboxylate transporter receptor subunit TctC